MKPTWFISIGSKTWFFSIAMTLQHIATIVVMPKQERPAHLSQGNDVITAQNNTSDFATTDSVVMGCEQQFSHCILWPQRPEVKKKNKKKQQLSTHYICTFPDNSVHTSFCNCCQCCDAMPLSRILACCNHWKRSNVRTAKVQNITFNSLSQHQDAVIAIHVTSILQRAHHPRP